VKTKKAKPLIEVKYVKGLARPHLVKVLGVRVTESQFEESAASAADTIEKAIRREVSRERKKILKVVQEYEASAAFIASESVGTCAVVAHAMRLSMKRLLEHLGGLHEAQHDPAPRPVRPARKQVRKRRRA
jgi:coenzyme F420-reducing hydrogenase gamma subunit